MLLAVAWQLYCYGKETPWQRLPFFGCSLFFLEQVLNFLFPGEGQDLKYLFKMFQFSPEPQRKWQTSLCLSSVAERNVKASVLAQALHKAEDLQGLMSLFFSLGRFYFLYHKYLNCPKPSDILVFSTFKEKEIAMPLCKQSSSQESRKFRWLAVLAFLLLVSFLFHTIHKFQTIW